MADSGEFHSWFLATLLQSVFSLLTTSQVLRPLLPFFAAGGVTYYLVSKMQEAGIRCARLKSVSYSCILTRGLVNSTRIRQRPQEPVRGSSCKGKGRSAPLKDGVGMRRS